MRIALLVASLLLSTQCLAVPEAPSRLCIDNACPPEAESPGSAIKWHPGHYMLVFRGDSHQTVMSQRIPEICREAGLQGMQLRADWFELETTRGQYTYTEIDEIYDALAACGKRLVLEVWAVRFNSTSPDGIVPDYIRDGSEYNGGVARTRTGYIARMWEPAVMDRLIALYQALARRYDSRPNFEGIIFTETATSGVEEGYSAAAWIAQLNRAVAAMKVAWTRTNVVVFNNFIQGATEAQLSALYESLRANRAGTGAPDVLPPPHSLRGEMIFRGETGGRDLRGAMPSMFAVQTPELGGKEGTFTPKQLYDHCVGTNACSHMFWIRNTINGGAEQMWDTGILPFLRTKPKTNTTCPANYDSCVQ
jgi:hypothetical protein